MRSLGVVKKPWGKETYLVNTELYCAKMMHCKDDVWTSGGRWHYHERKDETFLVLEGILELEVCPVGGQKKVHILSRNQSMRVRPGVRHRFRSPGCRFLEVSTRDEAKDTVRVEYE